MVKRMRDALVRFHKDEGGIDMVEYVLLIAIVALPLLAVVIYFWKDIARWVGELWGKIREETPGTGSTDPSTL
ncbi:MAG: hypothetical protein FWE88_08495 [Phycisphaerae bacterium]|nr:hypothetical protein [Phycisphaerae bacterium]